MKINLTVEVSDEALIAIGLSKNKVLIRATRVEAREFIVDDVEAMLIEQESVIHRITSNVLDTLGMNLEPMVDAKLQPDDETRR